MRGNAEGPLVVELAGQLSDEIELDANVFSWLQVAQSHL